MNDLIAQLQKLGDGEHDDTSVAYDAIEEIVSLRIRVASLEEAIKEAGFTVVANCGGCRMKSPEQTRAECEAREQRVLEGIESIRLLQMQIHERMYLDGLIRNPEARTREGE